MVTLENRFGSAALRAPSIVTSILFRGTPVSLACISIRVTPQDETPARNASLLVKASGWGRDDESRTSRWPRASLRARPTTPLFDDRTVSIFMSLTLISPLRSWRPTSRYITRWAPAAERPFFSWRAWTPPRLRWILMAAASRPNSLQQAASAVFAVTTVLPLLIFVWTLYRLGTLSRLHSQLGLGLALAVALLGFYFFRRLMGRMSELIQGLGRAVERSARPIAERQPHATGHPPAGLITEYQPPIAGSPPHAAQVARPASGRVATAASAPTPAAAPHAVEATAPEPSARAIPGLGMIREVDDLSHAMAKLWMGEAIGHKG